MDSIAMTSLCFPEMLLICIQIIICLHTLKPIYFFFAKLCLKDLYLNVSAKNKPENLNSLVPSQLNLII